MKSIFADTFYLALLNPRDQDHALAVDFSRRHKVQIFSTAWILTEVADALSRPPGREIAAALIKNLETNPHFSIIPADPNLFHQGLDLYSSRPDKSWSLTDCISFVTMQQHGLTEALTGDHHFEQAGFKALLLH